MVAPSCSLLHVPVDLAQETRLDPEMKAWLAFAVQKLDEVATLARGLDEGEAAIAAELAASDAALRARRTSAARPPARGRRRASPRSRPRWSSAPAAFAARRAAQQARLNLPAVSHHHHRLLPADCRGAPGPRGARPRRNLRGRLRPRIGGWIAEAVRWQERIGLDVLVHGEFERNDMVQYFGEQLDGFAFTQHGWVQSYGSRCVAPPIIWGDVSRPAPMTVRWSAYAQSLTDRPMKGMLTGPVTMLQWSFVRDDLPRETVCRQIALAIRDEVADLEAAGIGVIQVDEPAFREGLPLRRAEWAAYLRWAVACFRLATCRRARRDRHPHAYVLFGVQRHHGRDRRHGRGRHLHRDHPQPDGAARRLRGQRLAYPAEIGPGVWDIHSPRVPSAGEMAELLGLARPRLQDWQIWVNPDCGLKTRSWEEVRPALENLVAAARQLRAEATRL